MVGHQLRDAHLQRHTDRIDLARRDGSGHRLLRAGALTQPVPPDRLPHLHRSDTEPVARIDAGNDDLMRYVVRRYAYDPQRRERRHQIVAAFDDEREWGAFLD